MICFTSCFNLVFMVRDKSENVLSWGNGNWKVFGIGSNIKTFVKGIKIKGLIRVCIG